MSPRVDNPVNVKAGAADSNADAKGCRAPDRDRGWQGGQGPRCVLCCDRGTSSPRTTGEAVEQGRATSREGSRTEARSGSPELGRPPQIRDEGQQAGCGGPERGARAPNEGDGESCPWDFGSLGWRTQERCVESERSGKRVQEEPLSQGEEDRSWRRGRGAGGLGG